MSALHKRKQNIYHDYASVQKELPDVTAICSWCSCVLCANWVSLADVLTGAMAL